MHVVSSVTLVACALLAVGCSRLRGKGGDAGLEAAASAATTAAPDVPSEPGINPTTDPACVVKVGEFPPPPPNTGPRDLLKLRAGGRTFAVVREAKEIEVRFALGANGGTATVKAKNATYAGEIKLADVVLAPKKDAAGTPPWLVVHSLRVTSVEAQKVVVKMAVPQATQMVLPLPQSYACADLVLGATAQEGARDAATLKKETDLKTDGGEVIAKLTLPKKPPPPTKSGIGVGAVQPSTFSILEHAGKKTKVRVLGSDTDVEGWVEGNVLAKKTTQDVGMMGLLNTAKPAPPIRVRCAETIGVYVDDGDRTLRVGTLDANALIESTRTDGIRSFLDLGAHSDFAAMMSGEEIAHPYIRSKSIALCPNATE